MEITFTESDLPDGKGHKCLRGTTEKDGTLYHAHEGIDGRPREELEKIIRVRLETALGEEK